MSPCVFMSIQNIGQSIYLKKTKDQFLGGKLQRNLIQNANFVNKNAPSIKAEKFR